MNKFFFRKRFFAVFLVLSVFAAESSFAKAITFKEQYYKLFHVHYQQYPDDVMENIYWLERAAAADFCNPQYALSKINDKDDWEKYRFIFMMHINLKLTEQHLRLGRTWDKKKAYFYDAPWKEEYLRNLETAETCYKTALFYWNEAKNWAEKADAKKFQFLYLNDLSNWEDEKYRIIEGSLNYEKMINRELDRLNSVRNTFNEMDENTY